jgi:hypothetical protein
MLLEAPSPATVVLGWEAGVPTVSPVWFRLVEDFVEFVVASSDRKLAELRRDPRCVLTVFETRPPFRGVRLMGAAELAEDVGS